MKLKKIFFIIILIAIVVVIGLFLLNSSKAKAVKISEEIENNTVNEVKQESVNEVNIRKSSEKANIDTNNMIVINDNYFIQSTNDIYVNLEDYIGKTIKIEGLIYSYEDSNGDICYAVVRNTPGCCGNDGLAGVDIRYYEDYPEEGAWVEVVGVVSTDTIDGNAIPAIEISTIEIKEKGQTFVTN